MSRAAVGHAALFAASFVSTLLGMGPGGTPLARAARMPFHVDPAAPMPARSLGPGDSGAVAATGQGPVSAAALQEATDDFDAAARNARAAATLEERIQAVQILSSAPGEEGLDTLVAVSSQAADPLERAAALTALRQRRGGSPAEGRIADAFRQAAMDPDPLVAVIAQSAQEDLQP